MSELHHTEEAPDGPERPLEAWEQEALGYRCGACLAAPGEPCKPVSPKLRDQVHRLRGMQAAQHLEKCHACEGLGWMPVVEYSPRGFVRLPEIESSYGGSVQVYESSSAEGAFAWFSGRYPEDLNRPDGPYREFALHVDVDELEAFGRHCLAIAQMHRMPQMEVCDDD